MKKLLIASLFLITINCLAQTNTDTVPIDVPIPSPFDVIPSEESKAYGMYRTETFEPTFGLKKVKALIAKIKVDEMDNVKISKKAWDALSKKEKFTYTMIHGESFSQNCDASPPIEDEHTKIFPYLPDWDYEADWSDRQKKFMTTNKASVIGWIKEAATKNGRMHINMKEAVLVIKAKEMIPFIVNLYKKKREDHDLLTLLMQFMVNGKYQPFLKSQMYSKLFGPDAGWQAHLMANTANQDLIMERAMAFYNGKK